MRDEKGYEDAPEEGARRPQRTRRKPFITWGYHHYFHGDLSRAILDKLAPDFPVIVWHRSCHEFFLNAAALKLTGIDEALGRQPCQRARRSS